MASYNSVTKLVDERGTDIIWTRAKRLTLSHTTSLSLNWRDVDLPNRALGGWGIGWMSHSKGCGQWLNVQAETSDQWYPQGPVVGLVLFNTFSAPRTVGLRVSLPPKLSCVGQSTHWREGISYRETLTLLEGRSVQTSWNLVKCKVLHLVWVNPKHKISLGGEWIESNSEEKYSAVLLDKELDMTQWCAFAAQRVSCILGCIQRSGQQCKGD